MLADRLREARERQQLSIYGLAKQSGVGVATISDIESGKNKNPGILTMCKLAEILRVSLDILAEHRPATAPPPKRQRARKAAPSHP